ncbi:hypothetical protein [Streptomyces rubiginosohelvolus]|uniref:hypothetical protein n=1 Tax=Streptomyces rubiginosohelvolus TaxID=67362 RepID=UPI0036AD7BA9
MQHRSFLGAVGIGRPAAVADSYRYALRSVDAKGNAAAAVEITLRMADRPEAILASGAPNGCTGRRTSTAAGLPFLCSG